MDFLDAFRAVVCVDSLTSGFFLQVKQELSDQDFRAKQAQAFWGSEKGLLCVTNGSMET